jgi:HAD superfamily hydrolase (TIGR01509 family)
VCTVDDLRIAWREAFAEADAAIQRDLVDIGPPGRWRILATRLGVDVEALPYERVESIYQDLTMQFPPPPMPGIERVLAAVSGRYRIGLISNTGVTGGRVLREVLRHHGLLEAFDVTVFSNEYGRIKPDPSIFRHTLAELGGIAPDRAVHIGDLEELDVDGALATGMHALRYTLPELQPPPVASRALRVFEDWDDFPPILDALDQSLVPSTGSNTRSS